MVQNIVVSCLFRLFGIKTNSKDIALNEQYEGANMDRGDLRKSVNANIPCELVDIRMVKVDESLQGKDRIIEYVKQIKNPHLYRCGRFTIRSSYLENGLTLEDNMRKMML